MGFLQRFFRNVFRENETPIGASSFAQLSEAQLESHLEVSRYGSFNLTDAVRPSFDLRVVPSQGYRHDYYRDEQNRTSVPVLMASVSRENLFETFMDLLDPLGFTVDVVLETSHSQHNKGHTDLYREHIDLPVLKSILWEYEDLLLNDGCTGLAVLNPGVPQEIQFDEHKLLIVYGENLREFERRAGPARDRLRRTTPLPDGGRTRPFVQRRLCPAFRGTEDPVGNGWGVCRSARSRRLGAWRQGVRV